MHQTANHQLINHQNSSNFMIATSSNASSPFVTVTTLGNHNTNFQPTDHRPKIAGNHSDQAGAYSQATNGNFVIINNNQQPVELSHQQSANISSVPITSTSSTPGRYICPYCQLNCAKPSVLQKHIRAHTNERPYPCTLCGFAFKTKSNLYKHCRSRAHIQRCNGETDPTSALIATQNDEDGCSLESGDIDEADSTQLETMNRLSSPSLVIESQLNGNFGENSSSSSSNSSAAYPANSSSDTSSIASKPYKPKFHNYKKLDLTKTTPLVVTGPASAGISTPTTPSTPSFFSSKAGLLTPQIIEEHISKIISDNEAIVDKVEALLQKKYHKITGIQRHLSITSGTTMGQFTNTITDVPPQSNSRLALALLKQQQQQKQHDEEILRYQMSTMSSTQPLNLTKIQQIQEPLTVDVGMNATPRKRYMSENPSPLVITSHQPEVVTVEKPSQSTQQLVVPASHPQNPEGSIIKDLLLNSKNFGAIDGETGDGTYACPTCKLSFRGADILKYHLICHCQGEDNILSRSAPMSPSGSMSPYYRSGSDKQSPTSLKHLASSLLKGSSRTPSSLQKLAKTQLRLPKPKPENININPAISAMKSSGQAVVKNPLPSPGPLLGNTRLVEKRPEDELQVISNAKKPKMDFPADVKMQSPLTLFGGDMKIFHEKMAQSSKNFPSGGSFIAMESTESHPETIQDTSPNMMRQGLSGGILEPMKKEALMNNYGPPPITPKLIVTITPTLAPTLTTNTIFTAGPKTHFQFPPSVSIYNPLTLPMMTSTTQSGTQSIVHGGRVIPYVPGIPGPNTMSNINKNDLPPPPPPVPIKSKQNGILMSPRDQSSPSMLRPNGVIKSVKKSFNFTRMADNIDSPRGVDKKSPEKFDNEQDDVQMDQKPVRPSFLRPNSLPLKPGTFTPKQHHGITPTANTLPLISPETPRPSKSCVQLYLNGHAYTYLGLKSSTKTFYCTVNKPQPVYIQNQHKLSMYSNWQIYNGNNPNIQDLSPFAAMSLYDSRQRPPKFSIADGHSKDIVSMVSLQSTKVTSSVAPSNFTIHQVQQQESGPISSSTIIEASEEYTYIRGRGRGKYVCQECGIRCKKPSMLKKHIRTHTDLRPYTCSHCEFSFKTKGNLTKHMKSKAHFKKCSELGISPIPTTLPEEYVEDGDSQKNDSQRNSSDGGRENDSRCDSDTDDSDDDMDDESGDDDTDESKSRMPEHEAAQLLLSLSNHAGASSEEQPVHHQHLIQFTTENPNWNHQSAAIEASTSRNRLIFANKAGEFDLLNHEKYYSDPTINRPVKEVPAVVQSVVTDDDAPMDLTKKPMKIDHQQRPVIMHASEVIMKISEPANLLNQLVSNTDKIPMNSINMKNFTDNVQYSESFLPQEYVTERALKDNRFKKSQQMVTFHPEEPPQIFITKPIPMTSTITSNVTTSNGLDSLADLAAKSDKLEVKNQDSSDQPKSSTANAKNVASEYLKLTQQKRIDDGPSDGGSSDQEGHDQSQGGIQLLAAPQTIVVGEDGFRKKNTSGPANVISSNDAMLYSHLQDDTGRPICVVCSKVFQKASQLRIHMNIHYMERKFRCEPCAVSFRTQGHLQKHERSLSHQNKVNMTSTFGVPTVTNPRPFSCKDCKIAFRIHGHLAKHLRSKMHVLKLECLQKLPFGTYAEMERSGFNLTDIDTSDCHNSLMSLRQLAKKLNEKDPSKLGPLPPLPASDGTDPDCDMNENYDSDSSDPGISGGNVGSMMMNGDDDGAIKRKIDDSDDVEIIKRVRIDSHQMLSTSEINHIRADD